MKHYKITTFLLLFSLIVLSGCEKCNFEGILEIRTETKINKIWIYTLEHSTHPIYEVLVDNKKSYSIKLNAGNYTVGGYSEDGYLNSTTLQIRPDRTTVVQYDGENEGEVLL